MTHKEIAIKCIEKVVGIHHNDWRSIATDLKSLRNCRIYYAYIMIRHFNQDIKEISNEINIPVDRLETKFNLMRFQTMKRIDEFIRTGECTH